MVCIKSLIMELDILYVTSSVAFMNLVFDENVSGSSPNDADRVMTNDC